MAHEITETLTFFFFLLIVTNMYFSGFHSDILTASSVLHHGLSTNFLQPASKSAEGEGVFRHSPVPGRHRDPDPSHGICTQILLNEKIPHSIGPAAISSDCHHTSIVTVILYYFTESNMRLWIFSFACYSTHVVVVHLDITFQSS